MSKKLFIILFNLFFIIFFTNKGISYDPDNVHQGINEAASRQATDLDRVLQNLNFNNGVDSEVSGRSIYRWFGQGGQDEDESVCRATFHFHDPTESFDEAGLSNVLVDTYCLDFRHRSSVVWSQDEDNEYSWQIVREKYYWALTDTTDTQRQINFVETFRGLGRQMHLIADASVPAHTRNDIHILPITILGITFGRPTIESWTSQNAFDLDYNASAIDYSIVDYSLVPGLVPITNFWDTMPLAGYNSNPIGIAEYSNYNFLSKDTIFKDYTYPQQLDNYSLESTIAEDGTTDYKVYINGMTSDGIPIQYLASTGYLWSELSAQFPYDLDDGRFNLDDNCYEDYASILIPKAVSYSAGLLDYFFRGNINIIWDYGISRYRIENLSDEDMEGNLNSFKLFYDDINDNRNELPLIFYDEFTNPITDPETILTIPAQNTSTFTVDFTYPSNPKAYVLVFNGKLGNEDSAVVGRVYNTTYFVIIPVDPATRELLPKAYYYISDISSANTLTAIDETDLPFAVVDDGGYWDEATSTWTATTHPDSLGVPLSVGGPQYIAKYWDKANNRVRFMPNMSYEKNAYQDFHKVYQISGQTIKDFYYVIFEGSPLSKFGAYEENPGYMEYIGDPNNPGSYGLYSIRPILASNPSERFFSWYNSLNFMGTFLEYDSARFYRFDMTTDVQTVPVDADAPMPSVVAVTNTGGGFDVKTPSIFNYVRLNPYWSGSTEYGSSGIDNYTADIGLPMNYSSTENKCLTEDSNCGNIYEGSSSVNTVFDIPYNFNSYVRVHINDGGQYYEELDINGQKVETSAVSSTQLETHYQILAIYKDIAVIRETNVVSFNSIPLDYAYAHPGAPGLPIARAIKDEWDFTARYYIYIKGVRYDLSGTTNIKAKKLDTIAETFSPPYPPIVNYLTWETVEDITGYHIDRIFISDSFDGNNILVVFDEYSYNNGAGLVHDLKYEESDLLDGRYFLYYDIPPNEIQGVSHEALPVGRQLLLFKADGTLDDSLQDPSGLNYLIGNMGILN